MHTLPDPHDPPGTTPVLLLPWVTRRVDTQQGVLSRQLPARAAAVLAAHGCPARAVQWLAHREGGVAHVLLETPVPDDEVRALCAENEDGPAVVGRWEAGADVYRLVLHLFTADGATEILDREFTRRALPDVPTEAAAAIGEALGHVRGANAPMPSEDVDAFLARLIDDDNAALIARHGIEALAAPEDGWRWLVRAARVGDPDAEDVLLARIASWEAAGAVDHAVAAHRALAEMRRRSSLWQQNAALADRAGRRADALRAAEFAAAAPDADCQAHLLHGVMLVREGRFHEAIVPLREAARGPSRQRASVWLGVALAATGSLDQAIALWRAVEAETDDDDLRRVARENLQRADAAPAPAAADAAIGPPPEREEPAKDTHG